LPERDRRSSSDEEYTRNATELSREEGARATGMKKVYYSLYDRLLRYENLSRAFKKVKSAKGAAGMDGVRLEDFAERLKDNLENLLKELREKRYRPLPVKRVEIPKPGGGKRMLGIPSVRDRVVQQALLEILQPIFETDFHPSSYGYRPGRSCHQAISKATMFMRKYNRHWAVDMDLSKCFDTLDHDLVLATVRKRVVDGSILKLLESFLKSGVMTEDGWRASEVGSPQGGVISPLIANVYLNEFDQFMMKRKHRIVRYADDILVFCKSRKGAENALNVAKEYLESVLKLTVNLEKTHVAQAKTGVKFLGVIIRRSSTVIQAKKVARFKEKVKRITRRNSPVNLEKVIADLNPVLRGFGNYFKIANCKGEFQKLSGWIRRRLRAKQLSLWKKPKRLHRRLRQLGHRGEFKAIKMNSWRNSASPLASLALPNAELTRMGLFDLSGLKTGCLVHIT
jgi:group II intron reverse transcriptase/maturase